MLAVERLREVMRYDPETGDFINLITRRRAPKGERAGSRRRDRWTIHIDGRSYEAHRLAWFYVTGEWPVDEIDHINGNPLDNKWSNLRQATSRENKMNSRRPLGGSGMRGAYRLPSGKWAAKIKLHGNLHHLGVFVSVAASGDAFKLAAITDRFLGPQ